MDVDEEGTSRVCVDADAAGYGGGGPVSVADGEEAASWFAAAPMAFNSPPAAAGTLTGILDAGGWPARACCSLGVAGVAKRPRICARYSLGAAPHSLALRSLSALSSPCGSDPIRGR